MGVFKTLDFIPQRVHFFLAVILNFLQSGQLIDQLALFENGHQQFSCGVVVDLLPLPCGFGVEDHDILRIVHRFVMDTQVVGNGLAGVVAVEAVEFLEVGIGALPVAIIN